MLIAGYLKTSLIEWPGKIASVIFTPGCNFRCPFCHNADLVKNQKLSLVEEAEVLTNLVESQNWVDAIVISGGEPTLQKDLTEFLKKIKKMGYLTMVHTNGTNPQVIHDLIIKKLVDYISLDLKGDFDNYEKFTNVRCQIENVKRSVELIAESGLDYEFRTTLVPGLHNQDNLAQLGREIKEIFRNSRLKIESCRWYLQQFRPMNTLDKKFMEIKPFSKEQLEDFQKLLRTIIPGVLLRGI